MVLQNYSLPSMTDEYNLRHCLLLAEAGRYSCRPNPVVGCVIVKDGAIVGEGWHHVAG